jgi:hypothetical protein
MSNKRAHKNNEANRPATPQISLEDMERNAMHCKINIKYEIPRLERQISEMNIKVKAAEEDLRNARRKEDQHMMTIATQRIESLTACRNNLLVDVSNMERLLTSTESLISSLKVQKAMRMMTPTTDQDVAAMIESFNDMNKQLEATRRDITQALNVAQGHDSVAVTASNVAKQKAIQDNAVLNYLDQMGAATTSPVSRVTVATPATTTTNNNSNYNNNNNEFMTKRN